MILSPSWKRGRITHMAGAVQWMDTSSSEGTGEEGDAVRGKS